MTALKKLSLPLVGLTAAFVLTACASKPPAAQSGPREPGAPTAIAPSTTTASPPASGPRIMPTESQRLWPSANPPGQPALDDAAQKVTTELKAKYANWYSGIALQQPMGPDDKTPYALLIYRIPNPALDAAAQAAAPTTKLIFVDVKYSFAQCDAVATKVKDDIKYWQSRGLTINTWGCQRGLVYIGVTRPDQWQAALTARYGADAIVVEQAGPAVAG